MKPSESLFYDVRGLRYHVRRWPGDAARRMVLLHGWMDVSASFQFLVDALAQDWDVYAPDWRGYGLTDWGKSDCYWFPDYIADLDLLLERIQADAPVNLVGHSLGGNVAALYAGVRPARIRRLVNLEGFGMAATQPDQAPKRYALWLDELHQNSGFRPYPDFGALADRLQKNNPRLARAPRGVPGAALGTRDAGRARPAARRSGPQDHQSRALPLRGNARLLGAGDRAGALGGCGGVGDAQARRPEHRAIRRAPRGIQQPALRNGAQCGSHAAPRPARSRWRT